ncbi:Neu5Ac permease [Gallibacterium anatis]|uniref:TRAP transporter large permease protein n=1 Tax=Gallibacterium anatis TaxID=750 RepID=A0A377H7N1_9PAST|nr:TRAP transporter large permease [Gallibacterium anatis]KGQ59259.1 membrane protein [Gallibacterium anatis DSM 16844 = F 149]STO38593.1 Neu5Ac permease [Gallibacterium anatis]
MESYIALILFSSFFILVFIGLPISFAIGIATTLSMIYMLPIETAISIVSQRLANGIDNFALLAIPFFILSGNLMNHGGIAIRLIDFAKILIGNKPNSLYHVNVLANMMFGSISGSATASAAAVGGTLVKIQQKEKYDPNISAAVNISSCISGLLIPPSNVLIVYSLTAGGISVGALFVAGYIPGILMGLSIMVAATFLSKNKFNDKRVKITFLEFMFYLWRALPSLLLVFIVVGGIVIGAFTATEASAIAVLYTFILSVFIYRTISFKQLPQLILESVIMTSVIMLLVGFSVGMSWAMTNADIPFWISESLLNISDNPIIILFIINMILLIIGIFMDMTPAVLIFAPIFLPIVQDLGVDLVHFGIIMAANLCIGLCTPPVGTALFVGCSVGEVKVYTVIKPLLPMYLALFIIVMLITYIPSISLFLPRALGLI